MSQVPTPDVKDRLWRAHELRHKVMWGDKVDLSRFAWPQTDADWRQTPHGAPWDANVEMAKHTLELGRRLKEAGLV